MSAVDMESRAPDPANTRRRNMRHVVKRDAFAYQTLCDFCRHLSPINHEYREKRLPRETYPVKGYFMFFVFFIQSFRFFVS